MKRPMSNQEKANRLCEEYKKWKTSSLELFGFFPIFVTFKETFLLRNLSGNALKLYVYLGLMSKNLTGEAWVSVETIARYFERSTRTIDNWVKELEEIGLIERMQMKPNDVAHTYLRPYGLEYIEKPGNLQKKKRKRVNVSSDISDDDIPY
ncbi:HTH domain-containing protein [Heliobacterium undosum]|uniref:HTH domain-containing protein n=1 Tax=Heliomicrobium undosum TaxID=121734 RepID=A0A845L1S2_9FIRM|nr:helix-turn-helix domain-containing protein [Heliomicrobium undosum]MZP28410.1 HTH domain-containing protein [Heliomicrobium undosum]